MKKFLLVVLFLCLSNNLSYSIELYYACSVKVEEDRSKKKFFKVGEVYGFQYFKINTELSNVTVHEQFANEKPEIVGEKKVKIDYEINFKIEDNEMTDTFNLYSSEGFEYIFSSLKVNGSTFIKNEYDYDFTSDVCARPFKNGKFLEGEKSKKEYKKWIKKGWKSVGMWR